MLLLLLLLLHSLATNFCNLCLWQTLIEAFIDVKTTDGYFLRIFVIGFTKRRTNQVKKTCYAQTSQCKAIRRKMVEIVQREISNSDVREVVNKL